jgi:endonuclease/exonuclease/phosphatase family metal-dependent hydrolase
MHRIIILFFLALILSNCGVSQKSIKLISYNIRLDYEGDKEDNWHNRKADLVAYIEIQKPDFLGVQEAIIHQAEYMLGALKNYAFIGIGRDDGKQKGEIMGIFYRKDKWMLLEDSTIWLSESPLVPSNGWDANINRTCTYGLFEDNSGQPIAVFNTHFDHQGEMARRNSALLINKFVSDIAENDHFVLLGDFNTIPDSEPYKIISEFFQDSYNKAENIVQDYHGSFNGFKFNAPFERRIDYIFTSDAYKVKSYEMPSPKTKSNRQLSDHFPIIVILEQKTNE